MKKLNKLSSLFFAILFISFFNDEVKAGPIHISLNTVKSISCHGDSNGAVAVVATGGVTPYTYLWFTNPYQRNDTATGLSAGTYGVVVQDALTDTSAAIVTITQPTILADSGYLMGNVTCNGGNSGVVAAYILGGTSPYTYVWAPFNGTTDTVTGLSAGCYTLTTTDANGCSATTSICPTQPNQLVVTAGLFSYIACNGGNGCTAATVSGGMPPYTFLWSNGITTDTACGLLAGNYTLSVTDINGCTASSVATLTQPAVLTATANVIGNITCNGGNSGAIACNTSGGTIPYSYLWSPVGSTGPGASSLSAGCYTVTVTDMNGCTATSSACVTQPTPISIIGSTAIDTGGCSGSATDLVSGGVPPYTYLWSNGATTSSISNLCIGVYCCTVTDSNGCLDTNCLTVSGCSNSFNEQICIVTLDTATNKCEIIWGRTNSPPSGGYGSYNIYRDTNNADTLIHSQALNVLSEYIDPASNPSAGPVSYKLSTVDSCGESALSSVHTSIYLTTTAGYNVYVLNWTAYVGFTPLEYVIFRGPSLSQLAPIDTVANNIYSFRDTLPPIGSYYVLEAVSPSPCVPSLHSVKNALFSGALSNGFNTGTLLGINNVGNAVNSLNAYPNPNTGSFTVSYSIFKADNVTINIINELGQCIYKEQKYVSTGSNTEQLNLGNIASGIYSLRIQTSNGITVKKLLIMPNK